VLIRWRKPCLRARRRLFGWNVRFTRILLAGCRRLCTAASRGPILPGQRGQRDGKHAQAMAHVAFRQPARAASGRCAARAPLQVRRPFPGSRSGC
jgi:hypothetical protein